MSPPSVAIPEKLFFKIGEVCELAGVQAHVLRYWESEFSMLAPQKNRAGQRVYRKRDVEMALRIKELLYEDQYTIAGAKKRLTNDLRGGGKVKLASDSGDDFSSNEQNAVHRASQHLAKGVSEFPESTGGKTTADRGALRKLAAELREILDLLEKQSKSAASKK